MNATGILSGLTLAGLMTLDVWAILCLLRSSSFSAAQRSAQVILVVVLPFAGAWVVLYFAKNVDTPPTRQYPIESTDAEDVAFASDYNVGGHE